MDNEGEVGGRSRTRSRGIRPEPTPPPAKKPRTPRGTGRRGRPKQQPEEESQVSRVYYSLIATRLTISRYKFLEIQEGLLFLLVNLILLTIIQATLKDKIPENPAALLVSQNIFPLQLFLF